MRIKDEIFDSTATLDELIEKMNTTVDGKSIGIMDGFKSRLDFFKKHLADTFPNRSLYEILQADEMYGKFRDNVYSWMGHEDYFVAIEFELRNEQRQRAKFQGQ